MGLYRLQFQIQVVAIGTYFDQYRLLATDLEKKRRDNHFDRYFIHIHAG